MREEVAKGPVVGRPEVLRTYPGLATFWQAADGTFPVGVTRAWWNRIGQMFAKNMDKPGPYDEPRTSPKFDKKKDHMVVLELDGEGPVQA